MLATPCRLTFCGHTHEPALYHMTAEGQVSGFTPVPGTGIPLGRLRRWLAIPGSAGQPRDGNPAAGYAMFDDATRLADAYDLMATAARRSARRPPEKLPPPVSSGLLMVGQERPGGMVTTASGSRSGCIRAAWPTCGG
jgi:diadenosine tetraphosphatase ApaH/serine/threonine PP2A family protein phosphatase